MPGILGKRKRTGPVGPARRARGRYARKRPMRRRYGAKPSRMYSGRAAYRRTRSVTSRVLRQISENKFQGTRQDCLETVAKPAGTIRPMSYIFLNTGSSVAAIAGLSEFQTPLNLFEFPQGTSGPNRIGQYMYIRKSHIKLNITCMPLGFSGSESEDQSLNTPIECRLMVVKSRQSQQRLGTHKSPGNTLFIDTQNNAFGYNETGGSINLLMEQPINKRNWIVYKDQKFILAPPAVEHIDLNGTLNHGTTYAPSKYPMQKKISMDLPVYKKTHFSDTTNTPDDLDTQWMIILQCARVGHCFEQGSLAVRPQSIRMEVLGTTSAYDN